MKDDVHTEAFSLGFAEQGKIEFTWSELGLNNGKVMTTVDAVYVQQQQAPLDQYEDCNANKISP